MADLSDAPEWMSAANKEAWLRGVRLAESMTIVQPQENTERGWRWTGKVYVLRGSEEDKKLKAAGETADIPPGPRRLSTEEVF